MEIDSVLKMHLCFDKVYRHNILSYTPTNKRILQTKMIENAYLMDRAHQSVY